MHYARGCEVHSASTAGFKKAIQAARKSQVAIVVMGLSQHLEGEEGQMEGNPPGVLSRGDRQTIDLPATQEKLLQAIYETGVPTILVLMNGSAVAINWAAAQLPAILEAWYPGQAGGTAIAEAIFGLTNPGGRLPVTFYKSHSDLPPFEDYNMQGRTYRYFEGQALYPFGHGLSYTTFAYRDLQIMPLAPKAGETVSVQVQVENIGAVAGDEVVQLYLKDEQASQPVPQMQLQGFTRLRLAPGEKQSVTFTIDARQMSFAGADGSWILEPGAFKLWVGGAQPELKAGFQAANILEGQFVIR